MKLAYIISVHKGIEQIKLLIDQLNEDFTDIYIHVDKNAENLYTQLENYYSKMDNIILIKNRVHVNWSGFSQVKATLNLLESVRRTNKTYDYISFISGQCYPLKSNQFIKEYLDKNKGKEFIECNKLNDCDLFRLKCYNLFRESKYIRKLWMRTLDNISRRLQKKIIWRNNLKNFSLYHGSSWWTITYDCSLFILNYLEENPWFIKDFQHTLCPDEHFFQILIMNSVYSENVVNDNLRYVNWKKPANSPDIIVSSDFLKLMDSPKLYARKFDIDVDNNVLNRLREMIM